MSLRNALPAVLCFAAVLAADEPSRKPEDYPAQTRLGEFIIAVENLGPSIPGGASTGTYVEDYVVIEVALFPATKNKTMQISQARFGLRINGSKSLIRPDSPGFVAAAIKYPGWENQRRMEAYGGIGNASVILGRQDPQERFPGDRRPIEQRRPVPNPVPRVDSPVDSKREQIPVDDLVKRAALPEGEMVLPLKGCLYFPYKGKTKKIKTLELVYEGPPGDASVRVP